VTTLSTSQRTRLTTALTAVCHQAGIDPRGAELMRYTMNAVFRIDAAGVVVRMTTSARADVVTRVAQVAAAFAELGLPTTRLAPGIEQPTHTDDWSATTWVLLPQRPGHRHELVELASPLRALHAVPSLDVELPAWDPIGRARSRLAKASSLTGSDHEFLQAWADHELKTPLGKVLELLAERCADLNTAVAGTEWTLPESVVHGDAHAGNLLEDLAGQVVIGDLDSVSVGPPEWDLVPAAHGAMRFGDDPGQYQALTEAYGFDVTTCPAWETLRQVRELQLVTSVIADLPGRPDVARELAHRLRGTLAGDAEMLWHRYR
jgi:aminoglycoside phosphotransferase (APT) family kinase protein